MCNRPTHARFAVEWFFKHVRKKKIVCDISGKKMFIFDQGEKNVMFSCWMETKIG